MAGERIDFEGGALGFRATDQGLIAQVIVDGSGETIGELFMPVEVALDLVDRLQDAIEAALEILKAHHPHGHA